MNTQLIPEFPSSGYKTSKRVNQMKRSTKNEDCSSGCAVQMQETNEWGAKYARSVRWRDQPGQFH